MTRTLLAGGLALALAATCDARTGSGGGHDAAGGGPALASSAFADGQPIPAKHTCDGADVSPPLAWSGLPAGTRTVALVVHDPDAPDPAAPRMDWVHWVLWDVTASAAGLPEGGPLPAGTRQGTTDFGKPGWGGPCPPAGRHRYFFELWALDAVLGDLGAGRRADLEAAAKGHVLGKATLVGTYAHPAR